MRSKKAIANIIASLSLQLVTVVCGFIIPRLIIKTFGSDINGLTSSITSFLGYITLFEAGVGGVIRANLYKPLANKDISAISGIVKATGKFFKSVSYIFIGYLLVIAFYFSFFVNKGYDSVFTFSLVIIIGASIFVQYYFGLTYQVLLQADQKQYISSALQIVTLIINTILVVILVNLGTGIHMVKLGSSLIFILRLVGLYLYVNRNYKIIKDCPENNDAIRQRWDGLGHHIAFFLHRNTDIVVLTLFANLKEVSVYSVYFLVVSGIEKLVTSFSTGLEAAFGNIIAKGESEVLDRNFRIYELISFSLTTILFTSTAMLILPFITLYTKGVTDANYIRPLFAYILIMAEAAYCIRLPYHSVVLAAGHFKQTRNGAFLEAFINVILSIVLVNFFGIIGVAIGTLCAMLFRTIQYAVYLSRNIIKRKISEFAKRCFINIFAVLLIIFTVNSLKIVKIDSYAVWGLYAVCVTLISLVIVILTNIVFYRTDIMNLFRIIKNLLTPKQKRSEAT
jgi:O-antigen/teichoic acid export membrane protein